MERDPICEECAGTGEVPRTVNVYRDRTEIDFDDCPACGGYGLATEIPAHYAAILAEAERIGWPASYRTDLTHIDRAILLEMPVARPFAWGLREHGTCLCYPRWRGGDWQTPGNLEKKHTFGEIRWYFWDGARLLKCTDGHDATARLRPYVGERCRECGGSGGWEHWISPSPRAYKRDMYCEFSLCERCQGSGNEPRTATREAA